MNDTQKPDPKEAGNMPHADTSHDAKKEEKESTGGGADGKEEVTPKPTV